MMNVATETTDLDFLISDLPEVFDDLERIPQDDGPADAAVCKIDYPTAFTMAFDYFRAILHSNEYSPRALRLTTLCLQQNPANYTVWHYRRLCLYAMENCNKDWKEGLQAELLWTAMLGGDNPKNYQIWYHRRALLEAYSKEQQEQGCVMITDIGTSELEYIGTVLNADGKNYHAWSHRQWVVGNIMTTTKNVISTAADVWQAEMEYAARLLETDVRNNSAWNHRWFALHGAAVTTNKNNDSDSLLLESLPAAREELEFCLTKARLDIYNESPFRYLVALLKEQFKTLQYDPAQITALLEEYQDKIANLEQQVLVNDEVNHDEEPPNKTTSRFISGTLVDLLEYKGDATSLAKAMILLDDLANKQDPIRCKYWNLRRQQIQQRQQEQQQTTSSTTSG